MAPLIMEKVNPAEKKVSIFITGKPSANQLKNKHLSF